MALADRSLAPRIHVEEEGSKETSKGTKQDNNGDIKASTLVW